MSNDICTFVMVAPILKKMFKPDSSPTVFKLNSPNYFDGSIFVSFIPKRNVKTLTQKLRA